MTAAPETQTTEVIASVLRATSLRNALSACLLAAGSASDRDVVQVLISVHVAKVGDELVFRATDRHRLAQVTVKLDGSSPEGDWQTLIPAADAKRVITALPKNDRDLELATIAPGVIGYDWGNASMRFVPMEGEFPKTAQIIPTTTEAVEEIALNPKFLADLAKMPGRRKNEPVRMKFNGSRRPAMTTWGDDVVSYLYLMMPVRNHE